MKKRISAIALVTVLAVSSFPITAFAERTAPDAVKNTIIGTDGAKMPVQMLESPQEAAAEISDAEATQTEVKTPDLAEQDKLGIQLYTLPDVKTVERLNRVIVRTEQNLTDSYGAERAYYYETGGEYILEYPSQEIMQEAYDRLEEAYGEEQVFQDAYVSCAGTEELETVSTETAVSAGNSWGIQTMGLDQLKRQVEQANQSEDSAWKQKISVAVIDTGIDKDHPALKNRINKESISFADGTGSSDYDDRQRHGTHVAGIVLQGTSDNVDVLGIRIFDDDERTTILKISFAIDYVTDPDSESPRAEVINMSLGETMPLNNHKLLLDESMEKAVRKGVVICAAAGNENQDTANVLPVNSRWSIGVGAITKQENETSSGTTVDYVWAKWDYRQASNYGDYVDFAAPGTNIDSTWRNGGYATESGTSMACPHLAAAAAIIKMRHPEYEQGDVYAALLDYTVDLGDEGWDKYFGNGYVDLSDYFADQENPTERRLYQGISVDRVVNKTTADIGKPFSLNAKVTTGNGTLSYALADPEKDGKVAEIQDGQIKIKSAGSCEIIVTAAETQRYAQTSQKVQIFVEKMQQKVVASQNSYTKKSTDSSFKVSAKVTAGDGKITYIGTNDNVATVSTDGKVKIVGGGTMNIYAMASETALYQQTFAKITLKVKKITPKLSVSSKTVSVAKKPFQLSVRKTGTGKLSYTSSKPSVVSVSRSGKVTVKKVGMANITVKLYSNAKYNGVKKVIKIYVNPSKMKIQNIHTGKGKLQINWKKKSGVSGYQIRYSTKKTMKNYKNVTVKGASNTEKTIPGLKRKQIYYVQIRAYQKGSTGTYRGAWSEVQKIRTK